MLGRNRRWPVAAGVFFWHALLLFLLDEIMQEEPRTSIDSRRSTLFFIRPSPRTVKVPVETSHQVLRSAGLSPPKPATPAVPAIESPKARPDEVPEIDWRHEASEGASNAIRASQAANALKFSEASKASTKKCVKPKAPVWRKGTPTYGFSHGLPFVLFHDNRCIFMVIFFGCGFGAKPQADSHLFDNMSNYPNDSSVPDLDECEESP